MTEYAQIFLKCTNCENEIVIDNAWHAGGMNDYGGFILECAKCAHVFETYIGRDVNDSDVHSGAKLLDRYDKDVDGSKEETLRKHGLAE